ncbi:MAG: hypothetical protein LBC13_00925 [Clostridiales bacterium]|jgi:hypothetical protein|nr:hypothetical protein [Clostridiales bacterium]
MFGDKFSEDIKNEAGIAPEDAAESRHDMDQSGAENSAQDTSGQGIISEAATVGEREDAESIGSETENVFSEETPVSGAEDAEETGLAADGIGETGFAAPKIKKTSKFAKFVKAHKLLTFIVAFVVLLAAGLTTGHFVATRDLVFVRSAEDIVKAAEKGKGDRLVFKKDVVIDGDLKINRAYSLDLNGHTLTVKGTLSFASNDDGNVDIGTLTKDKYGKEGLIAAEDLILNLPNADVTLYSPVRAASIKIDAADLKINDAVTDAAALGAKGAAYLAGTVKPLTAELAEIGVTAATTYARGNLSAAALFAGTAGGDDKTFISGALHSVYGGSYVMIENGGDVGSVLGAVKTVVGIGGIVKNIRSGEVIFQEQLIAPSEITVNQSGSEIVCTVTETPHADKYVYMVYGSGKPLLSGESKSNSFSITGLEPGTYELRVYAAAENDEAYLASETTVKTFNFAEILGQPAVSFVIEGGKVILRIVNVDKADNYGIVINGGAPVVISVNRDADYTDLDISGEVKNTGTYSVSVTAKSGKTYYGDSPASLVTYVQQVKLAAPEIDFENTVFDGNVVTLSWKAVENAKFYKVTIGGLTVYTTGLSFSGEYVPGDAAVIVALGHDLYYLDSNPAAIVPPLPDETAPEV